MRAIGLAVIICPTYAHLSGAYVGALLVVLNAGFIRIFHPVFDITSRSALNSLFTFAGVTRA